MHGTEYTKTIKMKTEILVLVAILLVGVLLAMPDLFAPPLSSTSWRQTQTAMLTENFVRSGFDLKGLSVDILGDLMPAMIYEFPLLNAIVGIFYTVVGTNPIVGKVVSLICFLLSSVLLFSIVKRYYGERVALVAAAFFGLNPLTLLMRTSFQPDFLSLTLMLAALMQLEQWRDRPTWRTLLSFSIFLMLAMLVKFPIVMPFVPVLFLLFFSEGDRWARRAAVRLGDIGAIFLITIVPTIVWTFCARELTYPPFFESMGSMFLFGDMNRFVDLSYYLKPSYIYIFYVFSGSGMLYLAFSLKTFTKFEMAIVLGIPLYLVLIPTSSEQHYYQLAVVPGMSFLMGKGFLRLWDSSRHWWRVWTIVSTGVAFTAMTVICSQYLLREDLIFFSAGRQLRVMTRQDELVLSLALHDRLYIGACWYTQMMYASHRRGWNLASRVAMTPQDVVSEVMTEDHRRAKYLVLTWYSHDLEPWFAEYIPARFRRNPNIDGRTLFRDLSRQFPCVFQGENFGILRLRS